MTDHHTAKWWASKILADNPDVRHVSKREMACELARKLSGLHIPHETFSRACRWLQNEKGLYLPLEDDQPIRDASEASYREEYGK